MWQLKNISDFKISENVALYLLKFIIHLASGFLLKNICLNKIYAE